MKRIKVFSLFAILLFVNCATQPEPSGYGEPGFLMGLWHGSIVLFSFIGSIFGKCRIYAFPNSGVWYDFGFFIGFGSGGGIIATIIGGIIKIIFGD